MFQLFPAYRISDEEVEVQDEPCSDDEARSVEKLGYQVVEDLEEGELIYVPGYHSHYVLYRLRAVS